MSDLSYIYALLEPETREVRYIGQSVHPYQRYKEHVRDTVKGKYHNSYWLKSLDSRGEKPGFMILDCVERDQIDEIEAFYISYFRSLGARLVNTRDGGKKFSVQDKERARKIDKSYCRGKPSWNAGKSNSEEHCKNMSRARMGVPWSEVQRAGRQRTANEWRRPIGCSNGLVYKSIKDAGDLLGIPKAYISSVCSGRVLSAYKLKFWRIDKATNQ